MKLTYLTPKNSEYAMGIPHLTDINEFATLVRVELAHHDAVELELEPGDATKYKFLIYPVTDKAELIVSCVMDNNWSIKIHDGFWPFQMGDFEDIKANPCTIALITDLLNLVQNNEQQGFFDFKLGRATI